MKHASLILSLLILPGISVAQHRAASTTNCPLSEWSTTGAACQYAPELPASEEARLKELPPLRSESQIQRLNLLPYTAPNPKSWIRDTSWKQSRHEFPGPLFR